MTDTQIIIQQNGIARSIYENGQEWCEPLVMPWEAVRERVSSYTEIRDMFFSEDEE